MQTWQNNVLKWEESFLNHLDDFIAAHSLLIAVGVIYVLLAIGVFVVVVGLCRKSSPGRFRNRVPPPIIIEADAPPRRLPEDDFHVFPLPHQLRYRDRDPDEWED
jgi:hypothetical protein